MELGQLDLFLREEQVQFYLVCFHLLALTLHWPEDGGSPGLGGPMDAERLELCGSIH